MKRLLRITSYAGHARYLATLHGDGNPVAWIVRQDDIPSPYRSGPTHAVLRDPKRGLVILVETAHRRYDVFQVPNSITLYGTDAEATEAFHAREREVRQV